MRRTTFVSALTLSLALAACQGAHGDEAGNSMVIVQVGGDKVTLADIQAEQPGATAVSVDPGLVSRIVDRKLLAQAAAKAKLDGAADYKSEVARAQEATRADAMVKQIAASAPALTAQEIDQFIAAHPEAFAARKFIVIDQIELRRPKTPIAPPSQGVTTLDEVQAKLDAAGLAYQRSVRVVDTASAAPEVVQKLVSMSANAVFELSAGEIIAQGQILQVRSAPLSGPLAKEIAGNFLKNQRTSAAVATKLAQLRKEAGDKIKYSNGFSPPT